MKSRQNEDIICISTLYKMDFVCKLKGHTEPWKGGKQGSLEVSLLIFFTSNECMCNYMCSDQNPIKINLYWNVHVGVAGDKQFHRINNHRKCSPIPDRGVFTWKCQELALFTTRLIQKPCHHAQITNYYACCLENS